MNMSRFGGRTTLRCAGALALVLGLAGTAGSASAASGNPYTWWRVCGPKYTHIVDVQPLGKQGEIYVVTDGDPGLPGSYCAVTLKRSRVGSPSSTEVWLKNGTGGWSRDKGNYRYYAGPVYARMNGHG